MDLLVTAAASAILGFIPIMLKSVKELPQFSVIWNFLQRTGVIDILQKLGIEVPKERESYDERMAKLISKFNEVTSETDTIVAELESNVRTKANRVKELEKQHENLLDRIEVLKQSPQYADLQTQAMLEKFMQEQNRDGKKSMWRDYGLFILGVATPYILNFILSKLGVQFNP